MKRNFLAPRNFKIWMLALLSMLAVLTTFPNLAQAREVHEFYNSVRCQAMGNACIGVVNDETALLVNPAALGKLRNFYGTILDPEIEINSNFSTMYNANKFTKPFDLEAIKPSLDANLDKMYHARAQVFPSFVMQNFGIGLLGKYTLDAKESADAASIDTFYRSDLALVLGYNLRLFDGRIKIGVNAKLINRVEVNNEFLPANGPLDYPTIASEGTGISTDAGIILTAPWAWLPSASLVMHDIGGTAFDYAHGTRLATTTRPETVRQDMDAAVSVFPIHSRNVRSSWTFEYQGLLTAGAETDKAKRLHGGLEFNFGDVFFLRGGYNQRYFTAGAELASEHYQFQVSTYGEEIGTAQNPLEDRRFTAKVAWRF